MAEPFATVEDVQARYPSDAALLCADETTREPDWARFDAALAASPSRGWRGSPPARRARSPSTLPVAALSTERRRWARPAKRSSSRQSASSLETR